MFCPVPRFWLPLIVCLLVVPAASAVSSEQAPSNVVESPRFLNGLARAERKHDYRALLADCDRAVAAAPEDRMAYRRRALARWGAREYDGALADFGRAIELARQQKAPARLVAILFYGRALVRREQRDTAAEAAELDAAVHADRSFTDPLNDLAWIRATNPDASLRDGQEAVVLARRACELVPNHTKYLDTLAAAYAEAGEAKHAVSTERIAIKAARTDGGSTNQQQAFFAAAQEHIRLYEEGGHYREEADRPTGRNGSPSRP